MRFKLDTTLNEKIYLDFNRYVFNKANKKRIITIRILLCAIIFCMSVLLFLRDGFTVVSIVKVVGWAVIVIFFQIIMKPYFRLCLKIICEVRKKKGKQLYSPWSTTEFYDDYFCDTTDKTKFEVKYSALSSVIVIKGNMVLLLDDNGVYFILPFSCFGSKEQYDDFLNFIKTKCAKVDYLEKI